MSSLHASGIDKITEHQDRLLLGYLNLPPLGAYADRDGAPKIESDRGFEIASSTRAILARWRAEHGPFRSVRDLINIPGITGQDLVNILSRISDFSRYGQSVAPLWGGKESQDAFFGLLAGAERYIHIQSYIIGGNVGMRLAELLSRKIREGIRVRVLFTLSGFIISGGPSGTGTVSQRSSWRARLSSDMYARQRLVKTLRAHGVEVIDSAPIGRHWRRHEFKRAGITSDSKYYAWARAQGIQDGVLETQREIDACCSVPFANVDHRKITVVDGDKAFIGSQNIADSYFYDNSLSFNAAINCQRWQWHDSSAIIRGGSAAKLNREFCARWMLSGGSPFDPEEKYYSPEAQWQGDAIVSFDATIPGTMRAPITKNLKNFMGSLVGLDRPRLVEGTNRIRDRLIQLPRLSKHHLFVEHCYPSDDGLLSQWAEDASRVPKFTLVAPLHYDTRLMGSECVVFFERLVRAGIDVQGYQRAIMHSKICVVDGWYVQTGSYNLTLRSACNDLELNFSIQSPNFGHAVQQRIRNDLQECEPIALKRRRRIPILGPIVRYFFL